MKRLMVADEYGRAWVIYRNDPAGDLCAMLAKIGVKEIVLPSPTLLTGKLPDIDYGRFDTMPVDSIKQIPDLGAAVRTQVRLQDCLEYLRQRGPGEDHPNRWPTYSLLDKRTRTYARQRGATDC